MSTSTAPTPGPTATAAAAAPTRTSPLAAAMLADAGYLRGKRSSEGAVKIRAAPKPGALRLKPVRPDDYHQWQLSRQLRGLSARRHQAQRKRVFVRGKNGDRLAFRSAGILSRTNEAAQLLDVAQTSFFKEVMAKALRLMVHSKRHTLAEDDVAAALNFMGMRVLSPNTNRMRRKRTAAVARRRAKAEPEQQEEANE